MNINFRKYMRAMDGVLWTVEPGNYMVLDYAFAALYLEGDRFITGEGDDEPFHGQDLAVDLGIVFG